MNTKSYHKSKLRIHGPFPPPIGGISVHIERLKPYLERERINYKIYNHGYSEFQNVVALKKSYWWYVQQIFRVDHGIYHFHQFMYLHFFFYFFKSLFSKSKILITIHSSRILTYSSLKREIALLLLKYTKYTNLFSVSEQLSVYLNTRKIKCQYLPAYIPPHIAKPVVLEKSETKLFLFSMWKVTKKLSEEVYDLPLALSFLQKVSNDYKMLFLIGSREESDKEYIESILERFNVKHSVMLIYGQQIVDYINNCDFILRTNIHDGYGVSLEESLDLGVPALATDVCTRPEGTTTFKAQNLDSLFDTYLSIQSQCNETVLIKRKKKAYHLELINLYKQLLVEK